MSKEESPTTASILFGSKTTLHSKAESILRRSSDLMMDANTLFGDTLDPVQINEAIHQLSLYLKQIQDEEEEIIRGVRLKLNDYAQLLGIGLMSTSVELYAGDGKPSAKKSPLHLKEEAKCPTIGVIPNLDLPRRIVGFRPDIAEVLTALSRVLHAGKYTEEELTRQTSHRILEPLNRGQRLMVDNSGLIGVPLPIIDASTLEASGLPNGEITPEELKGIFREHQEIYLCNYLTRERLEEVMGTRLTSHQDGLNLRHDQSGRLC